MMTSSASPAASWQAIRIIVCGWQFSSSGDKHMGFSEVFTALGVTVQLTSCLDGRLTISNTAKRIKELVESIRSIISAGSPLVP